MEVLDTPASESYFSSSGNVFLNKFFISYGEDGFFVLWKPFSLIYFLFCGKKAVTEINGPFFLGGKTLFLLEERDFLPSGNCFLLFRASCLQVDTVGKTS